MLATSAVSSREENLPSPHLLDLRGYSFRRPMITPTKEAPSKNSLAAAFLSNKEKIVAPEKISKKIFHSIKNNLTEGSKVIKQKIHFKSYFQEKIKLTKNDKLISELKQVGMVNLFQLLGFVILETYKFLSSPIKRASVETQNLASLINPESINEDAKSCVSTDLILPKRTVLGFALPHGWHKTLLSFIAVALILTLPIQALSYWQDVVNANQSQPAAPDKQNTLSSLTNDVKKAVILSQIWPAMAGFKEKKRYLVLFQNDNEIRPTGGFIGSFALVDIYQGKITNIEIPGGGPYDLQGSLTENVSSPRPIQLARARWEMQDANWFPDYPASAEKIKWFYEHSGGPSVDGVIALNTQLLQELLKITGPIELSEYGKFINADNFFMELQKAVEIEYDRALNKPKQIIADLAPKLLKELLNNKDNYLKVAAVCDQSLIEKNLLLYFTNPGLENSIINLGWGGEIKNFDQDYLSVINTNIGGQKSDAAISQKIFKETEIMNDGSIISTVNISRTNESNKGDLFTGINNVDYIRVYVPEGSQLISASGFNPPSRELFEKAEVYLALDQDLQAISGKITMDPLTGTDINNEFGKTVFGNWSQTKPGETVTLTFKYLLPFKVKKGAKSLLAQTTKDQYALLVQKQPGSKNVTIENSLKFPASWQVFWQYPEWTQTNNIVKTESDLDTDQMYGMIFEK